jgi:hypothetical protein
MTGVAWSAFGMSLSACLLHGALGLRRPFRRTNLAFAGLMAALAGIAAAVGLIAEPVYGGWSHLIEYAIAALSLSMSFGLASEFRAKDQELEAALARAREHAAHLTGLVADSRRLRDKLNTPLQTLEVGLALRALASPGDAETIARLRRAVARVSELSRAVERATALESADS